MYFERLVGSLAVTGEVVTHRIFQRVRRLFRHEQKV